MESKEYETKLLKKINDAGYYRTVKHEFYENPLKLPSGKLVDYQTIVTLINDNGKNPKEIDGVASCSINDNFFKRRGRIIATGRAMKLAGIRRK